MRAIATGLPRRALSRLGLMLVGAVLMVLVVRPTVGTSLDYNTLNLSDYGVVDDNLTNGSEGCRCLRDVRELLDETAPKLLETNSDTTCEGLSDALVPGPGLCLPVKYGQEGCARYDHRERLPNISRGCDGAEPPSWCANEFCYVDTRACTTRHFSLSEYLFNGRPVPATAALGYSYETCGFVDRFKAVDAAAALQGRPIRVTSPIVGIATLHYTHGQGQGVWQGPSWSMLQNLFTELQMQVQIVTLTVDAMNNNPYPMNPWWACIHMVTTNQTDICVGDFWASDDRREYMLPHAAFTSAVALTSNVFVTIPEVGEGDVPWDWSNPLRPFSHELWGGIFASMVLAACAYSAAEYVAAVRRERILMGRAEPAAVVDTADLGDLGTASRFDNTKDALGMDHAVEDLGTKATSMTASEVVKSALWDGKYTRQPTASPLDKNGATVTDSMYTSFCALVGKSTYDPKSHGGRVVKVGFGVFIMIVTQFWNSLITTGLVVESASHVIGAQSLKEASERGDSICVQDLQATELQEKRLTPSTLNSWNPDLVAANLVLEDKRGGNPFTLDGSMQAMDEGYCKHMVVDMDMFSYALASNSSHCNKAVMGASISPATRIAYPIRADLQPMVSAWLTKHADLYDALFAKEKANKGSQCDVLFSSRQTQKNKGPKPVRWELQNMTSEFCVLLLACVLGVLLSYVVPGIPGTS